MPVKVTTVPSCSFSSLSVCPAGTAKFETVIAFEDKHPETWEKSVIVHAAAAASVAASAGAGAALAALRTDAAAAKEAGLRSMIKIECIKVFLVKR